MVSKKSKKIVALSICIIACVFIILVIFQLNKDESILPNNITMSDTYQDLQRKDPDISNLREGQNYYAAISETDQTLFHLSKNELSSDEIDMTCLYYFETEDGELNSIHQFISRADNSEANIVDVFDFIVQSANETFQSEGEEFSQDGSLVDNKPPIYGYAWKTEDCLILISRWYGTAGNIFISVYADNDRLNTKAYTDGYANGEYYTMLYMLMDLTIME